MTPDPLKAAASLAEVLVRENDALQRMDLLAATALLPEKQAALDSLSAAAENARPLPAAAAPLGQRLASLAAENRVLLERAMTVQSRILGLVARASRPTVDLGYGPKGRRPSPRQGAAVALSASV